MDKKTGTGELSCKRCGQKFQTRINCKFLVDPILGYLLGRERLGDSFLSIDLSAAVDVYADWIDACDAVAQDAAEPAAGRQLENSYHGLAAGYGGRDSQLQSDQHLMPSLEADDGYPEDYDEG